MPLRIAWTAHQDDQLKTLRAAGARWEDVTTQLGLSRTTVISRAHRLGLRLVTPPPEEEGEEPIDCAGDRQPLPPGHPITWRAITNDTHLAGADYLALLLAEDRRHCCPPAPAEWNKS